MCDQLRWDYLSCYGHPTLKTPNIDWLAENGVRFEHAYCQSPVCGPSRASIHTGRYMSSHGVMWNTDPLSIAEKTMGEYLRPLGLKTAVVGKVDLKTDKHNLDRYEIPLDSELATKMDNRAYDPYDRDIGIHPKPLYKGNLKYNEYLNKQGFEGENPWDDYAQSVVDDDGNVKNGWHWNNSKYPSRVPDEHSESAYVTNRAMEFMEDAGDEAWCLHLGYYKPHWPYVASAPYHNMYSPEDMIEVNRTDEERNAHPVVGAYQDLRLSTVFEKEGAIETIIPAYMGLVKQVDDHFGRLLDFMREKGLMENTLIVFTSDHGDNLGDHWSGEKDLAYDCASRVPLIIYDPSEKANDTRGTTESRLTELIDLLPTFIDYSNGDLKEHSHLLEGRSLMPLLHGEEIKWRDYVISEMQFNGRTLFKDLGIEQEQARAYMIRNDHWKYVFYEGFDPQLFDMHNDPNEQNDLGTSSTPEHETVRSELKDSLFYWLRNLKRRTTVTTEETLWRYGSEFEDKHGILIGIWEE